jgi:hypothetical protein
MRTQVDTTQRKNKNKNKQSTKTGLKHYAKRTHGYKMKINNTKEALRKKIVIYQKLVSDRGALTMMCGRDEEP